MKLNKIICLLFLFFDLLSAAKITDENNVLSESFKQHWDSTLLLIEERFSVKIYVLVFAEPDSIENESPSITVIYNDSLHGFEIYQSNFENESNFVIPSLLFSEIIPEANALFLEKNENQALEYILVNIWEMLYHYKVVFDKLPIEDELLENTEFVKVAKNLTISKKNLILIGFILLIVVFLFVVFKRKKQSMQTDSPNFFGGMSKSGLFGGDFDVMEHLFNGKKKR
jgi:hypothetical protein